MTAEVPLPDRFYYHLDTLYREGQWREVDVVGKRRRFVYQDNRPRGEWEPVAPDWIQGVWEGTMLVRCERSECLPWDEPRFYVGRLEDGNG